MPDLTRVTNSRKHNWLGILSILAILTSFVFDYYDQWSVGGTLMLIGAALAVSGLIGAKGEKRPKTTSVVSLSMVVIFFIISILIFIGLAYSFVHYYRF